MTQVIEHPDFVATSDRQLLDSYSTTITAVVKSASQAVAHIHVTKKTKHPRTGKWVEMPASGSGFVISTDGYMVTNHHVIEGASIIKTSFADGLELTASLIGADPSTDIALSLIHI